MLEGISRLALLEGPTPIEPSGLDGLWVKRDDVAGTLFGGNKVRKLEYLLADALERGGDVLTVGAVGSNHVVATCVYGQRAGLRVHAVLTPQPDAPYARVNARVTHAHAEKVWPARSYATFPTVWAKAWLAIRAFAGFSPTAIPAGGSNALGTLGWVRGGLEIAAQVEAGDMPAPERVYVALGSGGTAAGLLLGLRLGGLASEVVAVRTAPTAIGNARKVTTLARAAAAKLGARVEVAGLRVVNTQYGAGYAIPTPSSQAAERRAAELGLRLDPTYSAKAFAEALAHRGGPALFVMTANTRPMEPLLRTALDEVPASLAPLLT
ncbi:MAG: 1-aminocyclopropane-1-carboxylate deaminase/D-cysteine desulfhydrase [Myxococcota bacterium]